MFESLNARLAVVAGVFLVCLIWTMPNFTDTTKLPMPSQNKLSYGLDIQGGLHLVMGIDVDQAVEARIKKMGFEIKKALQEEKKVTINDVILLDAKEARVKVTYQPQDRETVVAYMEDVSYGQC